MKGGGGGVRLVLCRVQVMMNMDRLLKHAVQEKLAITICINKVSATRHVFPLTPAIPSLDSPPSSNSSFSNSISFSHHWPFLLISFTFSPSHFTFYIPLHLLSVLSLSHSLD